MALIVKDRVKETTTTTGTGSYTLAGAASGFQSFADALADGDTTWYGIEDGTNWEVGLGTWDESAGTLARTTVYASSNSGSAVNWGAGSKNVFMTLPASRKSTLTVYPTIDDLPLTGDVLEGDQAYVSGNNRLYLYNGSGWYNIALVNTTPTVSGNNATYTLAQDGTATVVTMTGTDAEGLPITWSATTSGDTSAATVTNVENVFTITPSTDTANAGTLTVAFKASDGVNVGSSSSDFVLQFVSTYWKNLALGVGTSSTNSLDNSTFIDRSSNAHSITANGDTKQTAFHPYLDNWSVEFDGNGDYLSFADDATFELGSDDFTIECWVYLNEYSGENGEGFITKWNSGQQAYYFGTSSGTNPHEFIFAWTTNGSTIQSLLSDYVPPLNEWHHYAVSRNSNGVRLYVDGVLKNSDLSFTDTIYSGSSSVAVGINNGFTNTWDVEGYISNARIVKGTGLYSAAFTPSTSKLTAISGTSLLTCQSNRFIDNSTNAHTITANGDAKVSAYNPFGQDSEYAVGENKGSGYFDGNGDYLSTPSDATLGFGTGDFTCEFWYYHVSRASTDTIIAPSTSNLNVYINTSGTLGYYDGGVRNSSQTVPLNTWSHIAVVRSSSTIKMYYNGTEVLSQANSTNYATTSWLIGVNNTGGSDWSHGYISDLRIVKGTAVYTSAFTPPTSPVGNTNASLYLPMDNAGIFDKTGVNTLTLAGNTSTSTTQTKYADTAVYFDGNGDYLYPDSTSSSFAFGTGDFTIEMWINLQNLSANNIMYDGRPLSTNGNYITWFVSTTGVLTFYVNSAVRISSSAGDISINTWHHIAVSRSGSSTKMFIDGTQVGSTYSDSTNYLSAAARPFIGSNSYAVGSYVFGYIEDLQILKGTAKYTANFTAPTATQGQSNQVSS